MKVLLVIWLGMIYLASNEIHNLIKEVETIEVMKDADSNMHQLLRETGFRRPKVVFAQMMHETKEFQSPVYKSCNNVFGMKHNTRGFSKGICRGHAWYNSIQDCLKDYLQYQNTYLPYYEQTIIHRSVTTDEQYINFLIWIGYAEDPLYHVKLRKWLDRIEKNNLNIR